MMTKIRPNPEQEKESWFSPYTYVCPRNGRLSAADQGYCVLSSIWEMVYLFGLGCLCGVLVWAFGTWSYVVQACLSSICSQSWP